MAVNRLFLIATHSPFRLNNLRHGEVVLYRVFWGATLCGYKLVSQILLTAPHRFLPRTSNNSKPFRHTALSAFWS